MFIPECGYLPGTEVFIHGLVFYTRNRGVYTRISGLYPEQRFITGTEVVYYRNRGLLPEQRLFIPGLVVYTRSSGYSRISGLCPE